MREINKKAQMEDWLLHVIFYLVLLVVLLFIIWGFSTGKMSDLWNGIISKLRFM